MTLQDDLTEWFAKRIPDGWFTGFDLLVDGDEILVMGRLADGSPFSREETRKDRMSIASEAERLFNRKVAWGVQQGDKRQLFTALAVPVMTRLRLPERSVLDTLVAAGVARSRSDALAWCVRLVGKHESDWIQGLRDALVAVNEARDAGPQVP
jgi:hypothetical protein